jgi:hypothetical protein
LCANTWLSVTSVGIVGIISQVTVVARWAVFADHGARKGVLSVLTLEWHHVLFRALVATWALGAVGVTDHTVHAISASSESRLLLTDTVHTSRAGSALVLTSIGIGTCGARLRPIIGGRVAIETLRAVKASGQTLNWRKFTSGTSPHDDTIVVTGALVTN